MVTYKKKIPDKYVSYDVIVEEALCFGWVDGGTGRVDDLRTKLLVAPRRPKSTWSRLNKERVARLIKEGLMTPAGMAKIDAAKANGSWTSIDDVENLEEPPDFVAAFRRNKTARKHWESFAPSSRKGILGWIKQAKRPETRATRIAETVRLAAMNLRVNYPEAKGR